MDIAGASATTTSHQLAGRQELGRDAFLKLLVTQLKNQNPLDPMKNQEFVSQLSQMSQVEYSQNMSEIMDRNAEVTQLSYAASLTGRQVQYQAADGSVAQGQVSQVRLADGQARLVINDTEVSLDKVVSVSS